MAILLINNKDNSINWAGDIWDPNLNTENTTKYEVENTLEVILNGFSLHEVIWNGTGLEESPMNIYLKTQEYINDYNTYMQRLGDGYSPNQAKEGLFINKP